MKHLQLFEDFSSAPVQGAKIKQILDMFEKATNNFSWSSLSNWNEKMIKDAFLMIKTKPEFMAVNAELENYLGKGHFEPFDRDPNFDWLFEIYIQAFGPYRTIFPGLTSDEPLRKEVINHLVKSGIVNLNTPMRRGKNSPFAEEVINGDWACLDRK